MSKNSKSVPPDSKIWRCGDDRSPLDFQCPEQWEKLQPSESASVRFCSVCQKNVHLCLDPEKFVELARQEECVAIPLPLHVRTDSTKHLMVGRPPPWSYRLEKDARKWWKSVEKSGGDLGRQFYTELQRLRCRRGIAAEGKNTDKGKVGQGE